MAENCKDGPKIVVAISILYYFVYHCDSVNHLEYLNDETIFHYYCLNILKMGENVSLILSSLNLF